MTVCALVAGIVAVIGIVVYYEREYKELAEWADALSEEIADMYEQNPQLRGSRWL